MKTWIGRFNIYFSLAVVFFAAGCGTTDPSHSKKEQTTLRLYMESTHADLTHVGTVLVTRNKDPFMVEREPFLDEADITKAALVDDPSGDGTFSIQVGFNEHGSLVLEMMTTGNKGKHIVIFSQFPKPGEKQPKVRKKNHNNPDDEAVADTVGTEPPPGIAGQATQIGVVIGGFGAGPHWQRRLSLHPGCVARRGGANRARVEKRHRRVKTGGKVSVVSGLRLSSIWIFCWAAGVAIGMSASAQPFQLPTANHAIFEKGGEERYFVPTTGKTWVTGTFGCVRSDGWQMHEGLDIKCIQRDRHGEPTDPVMATADGVVAYINNHPALSNYGRYIVLRHKVDGLEIYSLYAHLSEVRAGLKIGQPVRSGEVIAIMGRTSNTGERISKERAHVHFELNLFYSDHFSLWYKRHFPNERDDHGNFNGQNLVGIDSRLIFLEERQEGGRFNLLNWIQHRTELCRVLVRQTDFSWVRRYPMLVKNVGPLREPVAGYEIALDYNGLPFELIPRGASQFRSAGRYQLVSVNAAEYAKNPARRLVKQQGSRWELGNNGLSLLDLLTY